MGYYKGDSYSTNHYLRHGKDQNTDAPYKAGARLNGMHDHIKHMDQATSHRTEHPHTVFRGGVPHDENRYPVGHKFTDHGYTGTTFKHRVAANGFDSHLARSKRGHKQIIHVIHAPKGTKAHYVNVDNRAGLTGEHEMVLHRGTKFKVTHHEETEHVHYIHSRVVGHHAKEMPHGEPHEAYSSTGVKEHIRKTTGSGVIKTMHKDETPETLAAISAAKKKAKLDASVSKSKEKL
jgi:hypothetical protein